MGMRRQLYVALLLLVLFCRIASAQGQGDALSRSTVTITLAGAWTGASVADARFAAAIGADLNAALGPQRATAWPDGEPAHAADPGPVSVTLVAWSDPGTPVDRLLALASWTAAKAYFASVTEGTAASPFVTAAVRLESITVRFFGSDWSSTTKLPDEELQSRIINAVAAVEDATSVPIRLEGALIGNIQRVGGVTFNLAVRSSGIQDIVTLLSSEETYRNLLLYYETQTSLTDGGLAGVSRMEIIPREQEYRTQLQITMSGSWHLVLQSKRDEVISLMRATLANAFQLNPSHVLVSHATAVVYPFNMDVSLFILHFSSFSLDDISSATASADYTQLIDLYQNNGGDTLVVPVLLKSVFLASNKPVGISGTPLASVHRVVVSGRFWPAVLSGTPRGVPHTALSEDLARPLPYIPTEVGVMGLYMGPGDAVTAWVGITQKSVMQLPPVALNTLLLQATSLSATQAVYDEYKKNTDSDTLAVILSNEVQPDYNSRCEGRCIFASVAGGAALLCSIIAVIVYSVWMTLARYVDPKREDSDLVRIPPHLNPLSHPSTRMSLALNTATVGNPYGYNSGTVEGPMYPPSSARVTPFGARNQLSSAGAPESRMTSFVATQPNASVIRQSNVVIPSTSGEKEFEVVVMPRDEFERSRNA